MLDVQAPARFVSNSQTPAAIPGTGLQARRSITSMTQGDQKADEASRLEAALLRIQHAHDRAANQAPAPASPTPGQVPPAPREVTARLDALIAELRALLGQHG